MTGKKNEGTQWKSKKIDMQRARDYSTRQTKEQLIMEATFSYYAVYGKGDSQQS